MTLEFLHIAHRYMVEASIIDICSLQLFHNMTSFNTIKNFTSFVLYNIDFLKHSAAEVLIKNYEIFKAMKEFQDIYNYPEAVKIIFGLINDGKFFIKIL